MPHDRQQDPGQPERRTLSRDSILSVDDRQFEYLYVPEWGGDVPILGLDAWEQSQYEQSLMSAETDEDGNLQMKTNMEGANVRLAAMGIREKEGECWFTEEQLRHKSGAAIRRVADRVRALSGMDAKSRKEAEGK